MSLDLSKLQNVRERAGGWQARCPACAEAGLDKQGVHLLIYKDGRFGCVVQQAKSGAEHRKRIFALAGLRDKPREFTVRVPVAKVSRGVSVKDFLNVGSSPVREDPF